MRQRVSQHPLTKGVALPAANGIERRRLLLVVDPECAEEARHVDYPRAGFPKAKQEIPIDGVRETCIDEAACSLPDTSTPEQRLLRNVVRKRQRRVVVLRQHP